MEIPSQSAGGSRGLWDNPRAAQCSKKDQNMLRLRKEESMLTCQQRKQTNRYPKTASRPDSDPSTSSSVGKLVQIQLTRKSQRRSAESCRSWNNWEREMFHPGPTRDLEKEKKRLQSILATGKDSTAETPKKPAARCEPEASKEIDRYQEVLDEIKERRQFLADMAALGQEKEYIYIINAEISQRIRELELLDKASSSKSEAKTVQNRQKETFPGDKTDQTASASSDSTPGSRSQH